MKLKLTKIYRSDKDKAGNKLKTKDGREYVRISIKSQEHGEKWLSGFGAPWNDNWQEGQEVEVEVKENGQYLNFERANPMTELNRAIFRHEQEIGKLWEAIRALQAPKVVSYDAPNIPVDEPIDFDESGAPLRLEPDLDDLKPLDDPNMPF